MRIAVLEDDRTQTYVLRHCLNAAGYNVLNFDRGLDLLTTLKGEKFDALLLDWNLPDVTGIDVLSRVRNELNSKVPAIIVTARNAREDILRAVREGADDYLCKPVDRQQLLARIETVTTPNSRDVHGDFLERGHIRVDLSAHKVFADKVEVSLSSDDFDLAVFMLRNIGWVLTRRQIAEAVSHAGSALNAQTLDNYLERVCSRLALTPLNGWRFSATYGHLYRLELLH